MAEPKYVYKRFNLNVDQAEKSYPKTFNLDKTIKLVRGIVMSSSLPMLIYYRGTQQIVIAGDEIIPEDFESKILMSGVSVPPEDKFLDMGNNLLAGNGEIKILYKDEENALAPFQPYQVRLILKCELI